MDTSLPSFLFIVELFEGSNIPVTSFILSEICYFGQIIPMIKPLINIATGLSAYSQSCCVQ